MKHLQSCFNQRSKMGGIFLLFPLLIPLGSLAGPFFPPSVPVSDNFGYVNLEEISAHNVFQYPLVEALPQDFLEVKTAPSSPVCLTESCILSSADLLRQMDRNVDPCQDFYKFACGGFIADTVLPEHKTRTGFFVVTAPLSSVNNTSLLTGSFNVLGDKLNENLKKVFQAESKAAEPAIYKGRETFLWIGKL